MWGPLNVAFFQRPKGCSRRLCGVASKIKPSHGGWGYTLRVGWLLSASQADVDALQNNLRNPAMRLKR